jgi:putative methanogenesis marker protein 14
MEIKIFKPLVPYVIEDTPIPDFNHPGGVYIPVYRENPYYVVVSMDFANTVSDCIIVGTNLETGITYTIGKQCRMTHEMRPPKEGEHVLGQTFEGIHLTKEAVAEFTRDLIRECVKEAKIDLVKDVDFAVYCTGIVGTWNSLNDVSAFVSSLAKGCMDAGIPVSKFTPPINKHSLHPHIQKYSFVDKVTFCGSIAGAIPISGIAGAQVIANDLEGDLGMAGIKEGSLHSPVDFRNPCISIDFGTILDGRITGDVTEDSSDPYCSTIGAFVGLGGAIADVMVRGSGEVDPNLGCAQEFFGDQIETGWLSKREKGAIKDYVDQVHEYINVSVVPRGVDHYGIVPVDDDITAHTGVTLIGVESGDHFSNKDTIKKIGAEIYKQLGKKQFSEVVDRVCARIALRLLDVAAEKDLLHKNSAIGFSGRAAISGKKPQYILEGIRDRNWYENPKERVIFVSSAFPRGASLMARCMASLGRPDKPIGGHRGGKCIMGKRIKAAK